MAIAKKKKKKKIPVVFSCNEIKSSKDFPVENVRLMIPSLVPKLFQSSSDSTFFSFHWLEFHMCPHHSWIILGCKGLLVVMWPLIFNISSSSLGCKWIKIMFKVVMRNNDSAVVTVTEHGWIDSGLWLSDTMMRWGQIALLSNSCGTIRQEFRMAPPHIFFHVTNILINVAVYSIFHLKRPKKTKTMFHVKKHVEGPYGTLSEDSKKSG